jgi:hypothetical protein
MARSMCPIDGRPSSSRDGADIGVWQTDRDRVYRTPRVVAAAVVVRVAERD